jgi:hypothetical protein
MNRAHTLFMHSQSDLFAILKAVGAFEYAGGTEKFCQDYFLHYKVLLCKNN